MAKDVITRRWLLAWLLIVLIQPPHVVLSFVRQSVGPARVMNKNLESANFVEKESLSYENVRVLGVCGGIGSGKSTVCKLLVSEFGCLGHIEADRIAHEVYEPKSPVLKELVKEFGPDLIHEDGNLDRGALGRIVFGNPEALKKLEHIVWPHVSELVQTRIKHLKDSFVPTPDKKPIIIVEAAVLLDAGWNKFHDGVWVVKVSPEVALARLQEYRNFTREEALQRIQAQELRRGMGNLQEEIEKGIVTAMLDNSGDVEALKRSLEEMLGDETAWYAKTP